MNQTSNSRRQFVKNISAGIGLATLPSLLTGQATNNKGKKKVVCIGGHPDDPESGCGGTLAKFSKQGHDVTIIYFTTGEAGIEGKSYSEAAAIRKQEAINACKILKATSIFAGQVDGNTVVNNEWVEKMTTLIESEQPDIVFTQWPLDSHKDHQAASLLTIQAWLRTKDKWPLYFYEVCAGEQTMIFHPTDYVDITETQQQKKEALYCHVSQDPPSIYDCGHAAMEDFRGREMGVHAAEAFIKMNGRKKSELVI